MLVCACAWLYVRTAVNMSSSSCPRHMLVVALVREMNRNNWRELLVEDGCTPAKKLIAAVKKLHGRERCKELACFLDELLQRARY